ncbi:sulfatase-like hydrolase/transferase [uncultured Roseobacter sp.]|uniref:sulfatase-like hydrolase/transferase n=1 Tax=uncultured Roseobacter sp. TaxID=114847 RepID=UPI00261543A2|nr:sulfatase-like hydrolase/transferase [uncultured Roseobacter sp.]
MTQTTRKNILLISFDDCFAYHHYRSVFGEPLQVPNLDRIAGAATQFKSAYCQAPICGPSRASLMSARTPHQLGLFNNDIDVFQKVGPKDIWSYKLKENGYFCSSGGKVHHGYGPLPKPIHDVLYSDERKRFGSDFSLPPDVAKRRYQGIRGGWSTTDPKDDDIYYDAKSANAAIEFLHSFEGDEPFYREVGFFSPHGPRFTPARFKDMYDVNNFDQPEAWRDGFDDHAYTDENWPQTPALVSGDEDWWRYNVRNYFSGLSHGDYHLGRVWDALQASRFAENTVVVILTDHGFLLGARNRFYKSTIWEQSAGIPLIIYDPDSDGPRVVDDPVALLDVGPTVLDYAGVAPLTNTVGRSLREQVLGAAGPDRAIPTFRYDNVSIRKNNYRFARYMDGSTQLFDLTDDIWNLKDLGPEHPAFPEMQDAWISCTAEYGMEYELE